MADVAAALLIAEEATPFVSTGQGGASVGVTEFVAEEPEVVIPPPPEPPPPAEFPDARVDLVALAFSRLLERDKGLPNIEKLLQIAVQPFQDIEDVLIEFLETLPLADATTWVLDTIYGPLLALPRRGVWDDDTYRYYLQTRVMALHSSGTAAELLAIARRFVPEGTAIEATRFHPEYPKAYRIVAPDIDEAVRDLALETLEIATAAGINGRLLIYDSQNALTFGAPGATHGWGVGVWPWVGYITRGTVA